MDKQVAPPTLDPSTACTDPCITKPFSVRMPTRARARDTTSRSTTVPTPSPRPSSVDSSAPPPSSWEGEGEREGGGDGEGEGEGPGATLPIRRGGGSAGGGVGCESWMLTSFTSTCHANHTCFIASRGLKGYTNHETKRRTWAREKPVDFNGLGLRTIDRHTTSAKNVEKKTGKGVGEARTNSTKCVTTKLRTAP